MYDRGTKTLTVSDPSFPEDLSRPCGTETHHVLRCGSPQTPLDTRPRKRLRRTHVHTQACVRTCTHAHTDMYVHTCAHTYTHTRSHKYVCMHVHSHWFGVFAVRVGTPSSQATDVYMRRGLRFLSKDPVFYVCFDHYPRPSTSPV